MRLAALHRVQQEMMENQGPPTEKGVNVKRKPKPSRSAFEWFVLNDSGGLMEPDHWPEWNEWRHTPGNRAQYVAILQLIDQLRKMPAPEAVSHEELVEDAAKEPLTEDGDTAKPH
jgi:ferric-dicitrate binding protein FerR (iron transport regulator)